MGAWGFSYDTLNRLTGAADAPPAGATATSGIYANYCWSYDAFGNRTMQAGSSAGGPGLDSETGD